MAKVDAKGLRPSENNSKRDNRLAQRLVECVSKRLGLQYFARIVFTFFVSVAVSVFV